MALGHSPGPVKHRDPANIEQRTHVMPVNADKPSGIVPERVKETSCRDLQRTVTNDGTRQEATGCD
jgi:hypothetical protein